MDVFSINQEGDQTMKSCNWKMFLLVAAVAFALAAKSGAEEFYGYADASTNEQAAAEAACAAQSAPPSEPPPLPFFTIEGTSGGSITPMAYLINANPNGEFWGKPAVALSYVNLGRKNLDSIGVIETLGGRVELGYAADRLGLGTLPGNIRSATADLGLGPNGRGIDIEHSDLWLHNFNVRYQIIKENEDTLAGIPLPAVTIGASFKYNDGIASINEHLGGLLNTIGYRRPNGTDFTLTATKTLPKVFDRPLILTAGLRESQAANLGFLGFADAYHTTFEGSVAYLLFPKLIVAYELRQKASPYDEIPGLVGDEDNWHALDVGLILNNNSTFVAGYGHFGTLADSEADGAWFFQLRYEF
jgi:hypothetical protein